MSENIVSGAELRARSRHLVEGPSGLKYLIRRPTMTDVINTRVMPQGFVGKSLHALGKEEEKRDPSEPLPDDKLLQWEAGKKAMTTAAMLEPKIVAEPKSDKETQYEDIPFVDREYLYDWVMAELGQVPLQTKDGETTVEAVSHFPVSEGRGESPSSSSAIEGGGSDVIGDVGVAG